MTSPASSRPLYERWPYPDIPWLASVSRQDVWQLHLDWLASRAGLGPPPPRPRVWIAGCGAWQAYPVAVANPGADVLATDVSERSLALTRRRLWTHGVRNVDLAWGDLDESLPDGPFDWIECYGVLMNLRDPGRALARMAERLAPGGVLRIMAYPWFGRRRVFQVARIAELLGLGYLDPSHPRRLRGAMRSLAAHHPLRFTFEDYPDAANAAGIVDGFLHVSGVAFSAAELARIVDDAGLELAATMHRPWGDPWGLADRLSLDVDPWVTLYLADVWQELKSNFTLILRRKGAPLGGGEARIHPAFGGSGTLRERVGGWWAARAGVDVQDRCAESGRLRLSAAEYRRLTAGGGGELTLFGERRALRPGRAMPFDDERTWRAGGVPIGECVPNPAWHHQILAFTLEPRRWGGGMDPFALMSRWRSLAFPLEDAETPYGFSPFVTWERHAASVRRWLAFPPPVARGWSEVRLDRDAERISDARRWAAQHRPPGGGELADAEARELWTLLDGYRSPFLTIHG